MNRLWLPVILILFLSSCKKTKEKVAEDLIVKAMTDGQWKVTSFIDNSTDITTDYSVYTFQFYSNKTVDAIKNSAKEFTGNWNGNASDLTITSTFTGAAYPIDLLNGTWKITDNGWTYVEAKKQVGADLKTLRLDKL